MATLTAVVLPHHKKPNNTWPVKIRITQDGKSVYLDTGIDVDKRYVDHKGKLKQAWIDRQISPILNKYRDIVNSLHLKQKEEHSAIRIKEKILEFESTRKIEDVNFINFCFEHVEQIEAEGRVTSAVPLRSVANSLVDYEGNYLSTSDITSKFLMKYEEYLREPRAMRRVNQLGKTVTIKRQGLTDAGVFKHMANLRLLFNACRFHYNNEDIGHIVIANNPFVKYKLKPTRVVKPRHMLVSDLVKLMQYSPIGSREEIAKDMFLLSFYLCGINSVDIYSHPLQVRKGRIEYNRSKTMGKRADNALISIKVPNEAKLLLDKYPHIALQRRYSDSRNFAKALNIGLKQIGDKLGFSATFYHARHSFATIARNNCRCSKDDVASALNHVDSSLKVTDGYIAKDWGIVDDVQSKVLEFIFNQLDQSS